MSEQSALQYYRYRIMRDPKRLIDWFNDNWAHSRRLRFACYLGGFAIVMLLLAWATLGRNLPDAESLLEYETPLPTVVRGIDGEIVNTYARERRVQLQYVDFPEKLIDAFLSKELSRHSQAPLFRRA